MGSIPGPGRFHMPQAAEPGCRSCWALCLQPMLHNRSHHKEPLHHNQRVPLLAVTRESPCAVIKTSTAIVKPKNWNYPLYSNWEAGSKWWCRTLGSPRPANSSEQLHGLSWWPSGKEPAHQFGRHRFIPLPGRSHMPGSNWVQVPSLLKPTHPRACAPQEKPTYRS